MTDIPPSRWKVVERGRRLVVIDTTTGREATHGPSVPGLEGRAPPVLDSGGESMLDQMGGSALDVATGGQQDDAGRTVLVTQGFYDLKAPRRLVLDAAAQRRAGQLALGAFAAVLVCAVVITFQPFAVLFLAVAAFNAKARLGIRRWTTAQVDMLEARGPY